MSHIGSLQLRFQIQPPPKTIRLDLAASFQLKGQPMSQKMRCGSPNYTYWLRLEQGDINFQNFAKFRQTSCQIFSRAELSFNLVLHCNYSRGSSTAPPTGQRHRLPTDAMQFVPAPADAADAAVVRRALDAGTAERHLLAERLFKSIGGRLCLF